MLHLRSTKASSLARSQRDACSPVCLPRVACPRSEGGLSSKLQPVMQAEVSRRASTIAQATPAKGFGKPKKIDATVDSSLPCPCGSGSSYQDCCQPYHKKQAKVANALTLLRARYTAYTLKNAEYIADTTHPESQEWTGSRSTYLQSVRQTQRRLDFKELIIEKQEPGATPDEAFITFRAAYVDKQDKNGRKQARLEKSRFWKDKNNQWFYTGSDMLDEEPPAPSTPQLPGIPSLNLPKLF